MKKRLIVMLILSTVILVTAGCVNLMGTNPVGDGSGRLFIYLADAPVNDIQNIFVTLTEVQVVPVDGMPIVLNDFSDQENGEQIFDLLTLRFDEALLGDVEIPTGEYEQIRLVVAAKEEGNGDSKLGKSYIKFEDGTEEDLFIPSGTKSGMKINLENFLVQEGTPAVVVLDVDVRELVKTAGNSGKVILRPTAIRVQDRALCGDLDGQVQLLNPNTDEAISITNDPLLAEEYDILVQAIDAIDEVKAETVASSEVSTLEDGTIIPAGSFKLRGLSEATYTIKVTVIDEEGNEILNTEQISLYQAAEQTVEFVKDGDIQLETIILEKVGVEEAS